MFKTSRRFLAGFSTCRHSSKFSQTLRNFVIEKNLSSVCVCLFFAFRYAYDACVVFEFSGVITPCDGSGIFPECAGASGGSVSGYEVMRYLGVEDNLGLNLGMLALLLVFLRTSAYAALRKQTLGGGRS